MDSEILKRTNKRKREAQAKNEAKHEHEARDKKNFRALLQMLEEEGWENISGKTLEFIPVKNKGELH